MARESRNMAATVSYYSIQKESTGETTNSKRGRNHSESSRYHLLITPRYIQRNHSTPRYHIQRNHSTPYPEKPLHFTLWFSSENHDPHHSTLWYSQRNHSRETTPLHVIMIQRKPRFTPHHTKLFWCHFYILTIRSTQSRQNHDLPHYCPRWL